MTHNHNTRAKALVSGGCVISGDINFEYRTFFSKQWCIMLLYTNFFAALFEQYHFLSPKWGRYNDILTVLTFLEI